MLRIDRKAHPRKGYVTKRGKVVRPASVDRTVYLATDKGKRGRGKKVFEIEHEGDLTQFGYKLSDDNESTRHEALRKAAKSGKFKEMQLQGKLQVLSNFNMRKNPRYSKRAARDRLFVAGIMK